MEQKSPFDQLWRKKFVFFVTFFVVFTLSYLILVAIDFVPEAPASDMDVEQAESNDSTQNLTTTTQASEITTTLAQRIDEVDQSTETEPLVYLPTPSDTQPATSDFLPELIYIERLNKTVAVLNPKSRAITDLDAALLEGVVRHPDSATLAQEGNVFILGHSSYLPNVLNTNFQAFNGIQHLEWGDLIEVSSQQEVFVYRVEKVYKANANDLTVPIAGDEKRLTLATCNSFGSVDDRYIVEAKQVAVRAI